MPGGASLSDQEPQRYQFGSFCLEVRQRLLSRDGVPVPLTPKAFDTLLLFVRHAGDLLDKARLMSALWPDTTVEENNLNQNVSALRRALGDARGESRYIATVPGRGYCFTAEVRALAHHAAGTPSGSHTRIAVLPFENIGGAAEYDYIADGLTDETIAAIGQVDPEHFSVIGRTSVAAYRQTEKTIAAIGKELDVAYLVESSMRVESGRFRVISKLIRVPDQVQIWSASFDGQPSSLLAFQSELSAAIAEQVRLRLSPDRLHALKRRQTQNPEAYDIYLRGRYYWNQFTPLTTQRAIEYFTRATELDPDYALAWSGLCDAWCSSPVTGDTPARPLLARAQAAAQHAVRSDPYLAEAQGSLGFYQFWLGWDWVAAESALRKAIAADPSYAFAHRMLGITLSHAKRHQEAAAAIRRSRELDPLNAMNRALSAQIAFAARDFTAAIAFAREAIVIDPDFWVGHFQLAQACVQLQQEDTALASLTQASRLSHGNSKALSLRGYLLARQQRTSEAGEILRLLETTAQERFIPPYAMALIHAGLGDADLAFAFLEQSLACHDVHLVFLTIDPKWDAVRSDARFSSLIARCAFLPDATPA